jgi:hypothetical protein
MIRVQSVIAEKFEEWDRFVAAHPDGSVFHLSAMIRLCERLPYLAPVALAASDDSGAIVGGILGVVSTEKPGVLSFLSTRAIIHGGPLLPSARRHETLRVLMEAFDLRANRDALFCEVWLTNEGTDDDIWFSLGYAWVPHLNFMIDLAKGEDELWRQLSASRRKSIRRSARMGVAVQTATTWEECEQLHHIIVQNYQRLGIPIYPLSFFREVFDVLVPRDLARCFLARQGEQILGGRIVLYYKDLVYDWYAGSIEDARGLYPDEALVWEILKQHTAAGYRWFDFGGAGHPSVEYGPREFKRRFGGELVNYGRLRKTYAPARVWLLKHGFRYYKVISALAARASRKLNCIRSRGGANQQDEE